MIERNKEILRLWEENKTGTQIANLLGITKGTVMGIVYRDRQKKNPNAVKQKKERPKKVIQELQHVPAIFENAEESSVMEITREPTNIVNITMFSCRYVVEEGDTESLLYCNKIKIRGAYCEDHAKLCYAATSKKVEDHKNLIGMKNMMKIRK